MKKFGFGKCNNRKPFLVYNVARVMKNFPFFKKRMYTWYSFQQHTTLVNCVTALLCLTLLCASQGNMKNCFKGTVSQDFLLQVYFHESSSLQPLKITLWSFGCFPKIHSDIRKSRCTIGINDTSSTDGKIYFCCQQYRRQIFRRCQRHRWQIMGTVPEYLHLKGNLKKKIYLDVNSNT